MPSLHESMQQLGRNFQNSTGGDMPLLQFYQELCEIVHTNIYLFRSSGTIFARASIPAFRCRYGTGYARVSQPEIDAPENDTLARYIADFYLETFRQRSAGVYNCYEHHPRCSMADVGDCDFMHRYYNLIPIYTGAEKEAGALFVRYDRAFTEDEICLCEYAALIVSLELSYRMQTKIREEAWEEASSQMAVQALSESELRAFAALLEAVEGREGSVVLSRIARESYVAKSLLTGALKKLESAGVISTRSMGVKGMQVSILNDSLREDALAAARRLAGEGLG